MPLAVASAMVRALRVPVGTGGNSATAMTVQPDGKIIVVGPVRRVRRRSISAQRA